MPTYQHPGVYVEEIPSGLRPIEGVATAIGAFLGYAVQGPIGQPELIFSWSDYERVYGGLRDTPKGEVDYIGYSVAAFFQNGGRKTYIVRLVKDDGGGFIVRTAAEEWWSHGIRVNAVVPGAVRTPRIEAAWAEGSVPRPNSDTLERMALPEDIAGPILFLVSDLARRVTGHSLFVDGGTTTKFPYALG